MRFLRYSVAATIVLLLGCSAPEQNEVTSVLSDLALEHLTVEVGTIVTWTNEDVQYHTITSGIPEDRGRLWDSGILKRGESFSFKFQAPGTYEYFCTLHPQAMGGIVTVTEAPE